MGGTSRKKKKPLLPPELPPETGDADVEVSDEDIDFVRSNRGFAGFLSKLDRKSIDKYATRVADLNEDELEKIYEKRNRKKAAEREDVVQVDRVDALPIKTLDGELRYRSVRELHAEDLPNEKEASSEAKDTENHVTRLTKAERRQKLKKSKKEAKKQSKDEVKEDVVEESLHPEFQVKVEGDLSAEELFSRKRIRLAEVGTALLESPEDNIRSLKELLQMCDDHNPNVVKLALMSLLSVFKDIIPGYRIRLPTEKELQMKVSKEVKKTRFYESTLLRSYKDYLLKLIGLEKKRLFHHVAVRCLCNLLEAVPHFNFRENLLQGVVKNIGSEDDAIRKLCCKTVKSLFSNEGKHNGEATLEVVRVIAKHVKIHDCRFHPDSIEVFLSLTFDEDLKNSEATEEDGNKPKKKQKYNKKESGQLLDNDRKMTKQELQARTRAEVNADFRSISFATDPKERKRIQSETLAAVFETYFRVLKHCIFPSITSNTANPAAFCGSVPHPLLAPCLAGLGKFSHLIDLDFMSDLMGCLKKLAGFVDNQNGPFHNWLTVSERLQCCIVAFRVMRNNLDALNIDLHDFFVQLYILLLEYRPGRDKGQVLAEALQTMLCEGKQHDIHRAAAFIKRLATFSLCFGSAEAMAALVTLRHLLQKNSKCRNLLENDAGGGSLSGLLVNYQPDASNPNLSGALASVLWELSLLSKHYNPTISSMVSSIASMNTQNQVYLSITSPMQAFADLSIERELSNPMNGTPASLNRKRKRRKVNEFVAIAPEKIRSLEKLLNENEVKQKLQDHFSVLRDIAENERLRRELSYTSAAISLYKEYKRQKKGKDGSRIKKKKTGKLR